MRPDTARLMIATIARLLAGCRHVAVGASSPIPAAGALLARHCSQGAMRVSILGSERHTGFTDGGRELFDCAAQGRIDAFFFSGVQIDAEAGINLLGLGPQRGEGRPPSLRRRFIGNFGAPYLASLIPRLILFRTDHSPRTLVERVDFVTAPGRDGRELLTNRCLFRREQGRLRLVSLHPGETFDDVAAATGFALERPDELTTTPGPTAEELGNINGWIAEEIAEIYPRFSEEVLRG
ncbi:MAG: CoA synthetase [Geminicoccaceae bacterium]|nr:CoA synthetase [Geminicoccaceae bacterium]